MTREDILWAFSSAKVVKSVSKLKDWDVYYSKYEAPNGFCTLEQFREAKAIDRKLLKKLRGCLVVSSLDEIKGWFRMFDFDGESFKLTSDQIDSIYNAEESYNKDFIRAECGLFDGINSVSTYSRMLTEYKREKGYENEKI